MIEAGYLVASAFIGYLIVLIGIGSWAYLQTYNLSDYILGGRKLGKWVTALSAQASDMSGWLLMGLPGMAYLSGFKTSWLVLGLFVGTYLNWTYVAEPLRRQTEELDDSLTLPDYFERRFDDRSGALRFVSAILILVFFTIYTSSQLVAGAKLFVTVFGIQYVTALLVGGVVILLYTLVGGFVAVSWTDALQGTLMFLALITITLTGALTLGGPQIALDSIGEINPSLLNPLTEQSGKSIGLIGILSLLGWGLGYFGQPHILARFMAIRSPNLIKTSRNIALTWVSICLVSGMIAGILGIPLLDVQLEGADSEKVLMHLATVLFHPLVAGVILAGILAAIMSTADSQLLVASSAVAEDLYKGLFRPKANERELLHVGRGSVLVIALVALYLGRNPESKVLDLVGYAWAGLGAGFGPILLLSLLTDRFNSICAMSGMITGGSTVLLWKQLEGGIFELYEIIPAFLLSFLSIYLVELLTETTSD